MLKLGCATLFSLTRIYLNGNLLSDEGVVDQHLRYEFEIGHLLHASGNNLTIHFPQPSTDSRNDEGRYAACSGGWDWSQYSTTGICKDADKTLPGTGDHCVFALVTQRRPPPV